MYVFQPETPLLTGTHYTVRVEPELKDTLGDELEKSYVWQFSTRTPVIGNFALKNGADWQSRPTGDVPNVLLDQAFVVTFLQPMDVDSAPENVTLIDRERRDTFPIRLQWNEDFTVLTIEPVGRYKIASFYELTISDQLRAKDGGTSEGRLVPQIWNRAFAAPFLKITPEPNSEAKEFDPRLTIRFSSPMKLASLKDRIKITPQPETELQWYFDEYSWELNVYGLEPATGYVVRILPGMADIYGNSITSEMSFTFKTGDKIPYTRLVLPWQPLVYRRGPQEVYFEQVNLSEGTVSLYPVTFEQFTRMMTGKQDPAWFNPKVEPIREWEAVDGETVRNQINRLHFKLQNAKEKPLAPGYYFIGVKGKPLDYPGPFYQGSVFIVATDNVTLKTSASEASAWVVDLESGKPQADVLVKFYDQNLRQVGETTTDQNGIAYLNKLKDPLYARVEGTERVTLTSIDWGSGVWAGDFGLYEGYYGNPNSAFAYLYTDRPLYRPGQDVYLKGIVREDDDLHYSIPKDEKVYLDIQLFGEEGLWRVHAAFRAGQFYRKLQAG